MANTKLEQLALAHGQQVKLIRDLYHELDVINDRRATIQLRINEALAEKVRLAEAHAEELAKGK